MRPAASVAVITAALTSATLCGCTGPDLGTTPVSGSLTRPSSSPVPVSPTVIGGHTFSVVPSDPPPTSAAHPSPTDSAPTTASASRSAGGGGSTCTTVTVRVIEGGASPGAELAALQFTNAGRLACRMTGFAQVSLTKSGRAVGSTSRPASSTARTVRLTAGQTAQSLLHDYSTCSAPLSDGARITLPGSPTVVTHPLELRACTLRVDPLTRL